jgi:integrase
MVHGTTLMLLYLTGIRVSEALSLNLEDVDLVNGVLRIKKGKFGKSRFVPMAQDLSHRMRECRRFVDLPLGVRPPEACFFPGPRGLRYTEGALRHSFRKVLAEARIPYMGKGKGPRLHDLRHSYAVHRMMLWYEQGADVGVKLPVLATYLGHVGLSSSQYYLRLTEDLVSGVVSRYQTRFGHLIEERRTE